MFPVPVSYLFDFTYVTEQVRPYIFANFAAAGAKHLVLSQFLIREIFKDGNMADTLQKEMADAGLTFVDAHAPFGKLLDTDVMEPTARKLAVLRQKLTIAIAAQMGVDSITIHVGQTSAWPGVPVREHREKTIDFLAQLLPTAEEYGMTLCIENIWFPNNTPGELNAIREALNSPYIGFCYDAGHANLIRTACSTLEENSAKKAWFEAGYDHVEWNDHVLEEMLPYVVNCHLHDNDGVKDRHRNIGHGNVDWQHIIPLLKKAPKLRSIQSEVIPCRTKEPIFEICAAFQKLGEL